ncbi:MAG: phenylalanine--tRNA ligase subunit beta [SAR202 cluster bacterium Io17-Chloro-G9]|nr:MAG: phenylalanine--tRNA ligase subunit beta [SAR202 cluster bacterium Io17-Chloro-G9]
MKIPFSWLRQYVDLDLPAGDLAHRLTMAGIEVGDIVETEDWNDCLVGQVLEVKPHPQADRLSLCRVSTGAEELEVVCGAPNVAASQKICLAKVGANLYNTHSGQHEVLKAARIRGVESQGMICSELELGLGDDHDGILVLPEDAPVGTPLSQYLGDTVLDLELTPNRLDCLSVLGVAHEVAALTKTTVREPDTSYAEEGPPIGSLVSISVPDVDLCARYTASLIQGISVGPSPAWLQERLTRAGQRPINNIVDVTNFVMLELNQPLHAFDFHKVTDATVIVRRAGEGETLVTLDGENRRLNRDVLVIADAHRPVGLAGVIGGQNSEIGPGTTSVLLESATFDPVNNRETAQNFRLRTEATLRFEKGLRPELAPIALRRATQLILQVAGGQAAKGIVDVNTGNIHAPPVRLTPQRLRKVLGMDLDLTTVERVLGSLGFSNVRLDAGTLEVTVPYWRNDVTIEEDLVEEVVRTIGYDTVPTTMLSTPIPYHQSAPITELVPKVKDAMVAAGMQEVINYPLVSRQELDMVEHQPDVLPLLRVVNPLNAEQEFLRPTLRASLLATLASNEARDEGRGEGPFRLFEVGRVFLPQAVGLPEEQETLAGLLAGRRWEYSWLVDDEPLSFYDAKGILSAVLGRLGIEPQYQTEEDAFFQPGRCAKVSAQGFQLGIVGEVHPIVRERFDLNAQTVSILELNLSLVLQAAPQSQRRFKPLSRYPAATRDMALVVPEDVPAGRVQDIIAGHRLVQRVDLFDIYAGENLAAGTKSLAFHVDFQSHERTLTAQEVSRSLQGLVKTLEREIGAALRS